MVDGYPYRLLVLEDDKDQEDGYSKSRAGSTLLLCMVMMKTMKMAQKMMLRMRQMR